MGVHVLPGTPPIEVVLRRSARARRLSLRVSALDGRVTLTLPQGVGEAEAMRFAAEKEGWLRKHLSARPAPLALEPGAWLPVAGRPHLLEAGAGRGVAQRPGRLTLRFDDGQAGPRLRAWLKDTARLRLAAACDRHSARLGRSYTRLTLRDTRSRWGSCTSAGGLNFSWRLVMAPEDVLDYVAAHEVAHLAQMNHSKAFWAEVHRLFGPHEAQRRWLRQEGPALHAIDFRPAPRPVAP